MSIFKKKNKSEQYQVMLNKMKGIVELKNMGLVKIQLNKNTVMLYPELWQSFDNRKKQNWCKNFFLYAQLFTREYPGFKPDKPLRFLDINNEKVIATFHNDNAIISA